MASDGGPLAGVRVLDLGTVVAGPFAATLLADFGAEVIKIELPGRGDTLRQLGPIKDGASLWFSADARGKRSVTLDLRRPEGRALLLQLAAVSDALVENFIPGTLDGWGLDGATLREANPRLVVAAPPASAKRGRIGSGRGTTASASPSAASGTSPACPAASRSDPARRWRITSPAPSAPSA